MDGGKLGANPAIQAQVVVVPQQLQQISGGIGADPLDGHQAAVGFLPGQIRPVPARKPAGGHLLGQLDEIAAAIPAANLPAQETGGGSRQLLGGGKAAVVGIQSCPQLLDHPGHHALGRLPGAVGGADHLDHILEEGGSPQQAPRPGRGDPGEPAPAVPTGQFPMELRQGFSQPQHVSHRRPGRFQGRIAERTRRAYPDTDSAVVFFLHLGQSRLGGKLQHSQQPPPGTVQKKGLQGAPAVAQDGPPVAEVRRNVENKGPFAHERVPVPG